MWEQPFRKHRSVCVCGGGGFWFWGMTDGTRVCLRWKRSVRGTDRAQDCLTLHTDRERIHTNICPGTENRDQWEDRANINDTQTDQSIFVIRAISQVNPATEPRTMETGPRQHCGVRDHSCAEAAGKWDVFHRRWPRLSPATTHKKPLSFTWASTDSGLSSDEPSSRF